jgi:hypothetical protein
MVFSIVWISVVSIKGIVNWVLLIRMARRKNDEDQESVYYREALKKILMVGDAKSKHYARQALNRYR